MSYQHNFDSVFADLGYVAPGPIEEPSRPCTKQMNKQGLAKARKILSQLPKDEREHDEKAA